METVEPSIRRRPLVAGLLSLAAPGLGQLYNVQYTRAFLAAGIVISLDLAVAAYAAFLSPVRFAPVMGFVALAILDLVVHAAVAADAALWARRSEMSALGRYNRMPVYLAFLVGVVFSQSLPAIVLHGTFISKIETYVMSSSSGSPNLVYGDYVVAWKDYYRDRAPRRGELAVFEAGAIASDKHEPDAGIYRIIGLPGDEIRFDDGLLKLSNRPVTLTPEGTIEYSSAEGKIKRALVFIETLPDGTRYKIAQNPDDLRLRQGRQSFAVPPGHLFLLGDNRTAAYDSRFERFVAKDGASRSAYVPIENLRGRPLFVLFGRSLDRIGRSLDPHP
jgi:signal peptidase I